MATYVDMGYYKQNNPTLFGDAVEFIHVGNISNPLYLQGVWTFVTTIDIHPPVWATRMHVQWLLSVGCYQYSAGIRAHLRTINGSDAPYDDVTTFVAARVADPPELGFGQLHRISDLAVPPSPPRIDLYVMNTESVSADVHAATFVINYR